MNATQSEIINATNDKLIQRLLETIEGLVPWAAVVADSKFGKANSVQSYIDDAETLVKLVRQHKLKA